MSFFRTIQHLLPSGKAWVITTQKTLRKFFEGLAAGVPQDSREFIDDVHDDLYPATTRDLAEWEFEFGINASTDDTIRRTELASAWAAQGGQSPKYLQDTLQAAGFPVYVYDWWSSGPPYIARDPHDYTTEALVGSVQCGEPLAQCGEPDAQCNEFLVNDPHYIVNLNLTHGAPPPIPDDPDTWPYFIYLGGSPFGTIAVIDSDRRFEFLRLVQKYKPSQHWVVLLVAAEYFLITEDGDFLTTEDDDFIMAPTFIL